MRKYRYITTTQYEFTATVVALDKWDNGFLFDTFRGFARRS